MANTVDEKGIEYASHEGRSYYNWTNATKYIGNMTETGFRRRIRAVEVEGGITIPLFKLPFSQQNVYHDKRVLDVFRKVVRVGKEKEWYDELRKVINEVNEEEW